MTAVCCCKFAQGERFWRTSASRLEHTVSEADPPAPIGSHSRTRNRMSLSADLRTARACVLCRGQAFPRVCASCSRTRLRSVSVKRRYCYATRACHQQRVRACTLHPAPCSSGASNSTAPVGCLKLSAACRVMFALRAQARPTPAQALDFRSEMTRLEAMSCDACKYCRLYSWHAALSLN